MIEVRGFRPREIVTSWHSQVVFISASVVLDWRKGLLERLTARLLERLIVWEEWHHRAWARLSLVGWGLA